MLKNQPGVCPSALTDEQWEVIREFFPLPSRRGRKRRVNFREVMNAIFYVVKTGCQWQYLPEGFPNHNTVYGYFLRWQKQGLITKVTEALVEKVRLKEGRPAKPLKLIIDSQSTKAQFGEARGYDGYKKVRGRKRNLVVDTLGLPIAIEVDAASTPDDEAAAKIFYDDVIASKLTRAKELYADGAYNRGGIDLVVENRFGIELIVKKSAYIKDVGDHKVLTVSNLKPVRWIVERTFAWFNNYRRLSKDYERTISSSKAMLALALIQLMLRRLMQKQKPTRWL
jgi:putative transposase